MNLNVAVIHRTSRRFIRVNADAGEPDILVDISPRLSVLEEDVQLLDYTEETVNALLVEPYKTMILKFDNDNLEAAHWVSLPEGDDDYHENGSAISVARFVDWVRGRVKLYSELAVVDATAEDTEVPKRKCPICLRKFREVNTVAVFGCFHVFHTHCIQRWIDRRIGQRQHPNCPYCREKVSLTYDMNTGEVIPPDDDDE